MQVPCLCSPQRPTIRCLDNSENCGEHNLKFLPSAKKHVYHFFVLYSKNRYGLLDSSLVRLLIIACSITIRISWSHSSLNSFKAYIINWTQIIYENMHIEWFFISWNKKYIVLLESEIIRLVESSIKSFIFMLSSVIQKFCHGFFRYQHNLSSNFIY